MKDPRHLAIGDYSYSLPEDRIAKYPLAERDSSNLLIYRDGSISTDIYRNLADHIEPGSLMVFNNTRVISARLLFQKPTGGVIELFCLEPGEEYSGISLAMQQKNNVRWKCLVGGASKWKPGQVLEKTVRDGSTVIHLTAKYIEKQTGSFLIGFTWTPAHLLFSEIIEYFGTTPLPPYIKRKAEASDADRYQTIYSEMEGSVAAPTAGLHFTPHVFNELDRKKIGRETLTLHVGAGTFKPVKSERIGDHEMHAEFIEVNKETIKVLAGKTDRPVIAVGTTSLRTLESLYWLGVKVSRQPTVNSGQLAVGQWEPYNNEHIISREEALNSLLNYLEKENLTTLVARTSLLVAPGYEFKIVDSLVTNFHQPNSTLLLLVAAFIGDDWKKVYAYALQHDFRFLSYGDGCLLHRNISSSSKGTQQ